MDEIDKPKEDKLTSSLQFVAGFLDLGIEVKITTDQCEIRSNGVTYVPDMRSVGEFIQALEFINSAVEESQDGH